MEYINIKVDEVPKCWLEVSSDQQNRLLVRGTLLKAKGELVNEACDRRLHIRLARGEASFATGHASFLDSFFLYFTIEHALSYLELRVLRVDGYPATVRQQLPINIYAMIIMIRHWSFQKDEPLPSLPVPHLETTMQKYLAQVEAISPTHLDRARILVRQFLSGPGPKLQQKLLERRQTTANWLRKRSQL
ncbi:hypothetical protein KQX54_014165 [Cotesia glomerata]|uniref:Choline/carnitine acyltransferase domain-containing protein n=1 Tax=Cotesia glomerata TaxID=32391 RepID=A0AAV7IQN3_COTGL|nr:hypothetical protein KQX54_014165 [Cotesia glomerata]